MLRLFCLFLFISIAFLSCSKDENTTTRVAGITPFTVTVDQRMAVSATISWTEANSLDGDSLRYKVYINNRLTDSSLIIRNSVITGISPDTLYLGKVVAYNINGDTISAPFILNKVKEYAGFNSGDEFVMYNLVSGLKMWSKRWSGGSTYESGPPTISNDTIFFSNPNISAGNGNTLLAYNIKTGTQIWGSLQGSLTSHIQHKTSATYESGKLYISLADGITCINSNTGQRLWTYAHSLFGTSGSPVLSGNRLFIGIGTKVIALDKTTGALAWDINTGYTTTRFVAMNNQIMVGSNSTLLALSQTNGATIWQRAFPGTIYQIPPVEVSNVIVVFSNNDGYYGVNASTGVVLWRKGGDWISTARMTAGNGKVYVTDDGNNVMEALNPATGSVLWSTPINLTRWDEHSFTYAENKIYSNLNGLSSSSYIRDAQNGDFIKYS